MNVHSPEDVYPMVEQLVVSLRRDGASRLAAILDHRMHAVAWSSACELLEELRAALSGPHTESQLMSPRTADELTRVIAGIESLLAGTSRLG